MTDEPCTEVPRAMRWPTPQEFVDEWAVATDARRIDTATRAIDAGQRAGRCFEMNHEGELERLRAATKHNAVQASRATRALDNATEALERIAAAVGITTDDPSFLIEELPGVIRAALDGA